MIHSIKHAIAGICLLVLMPALHAQNPQRITINECYTLAKENYPLLRQRDLIAKSKEYTVQNASKGYLPQVSINGQATYQSEVTQIPIQLPGMNIPTLSKDQYKLYGEINQPIFDGGVIKQQKQTQEANAMVEQQKLEVELYKLNERINQLYFGILMIDEQVKQSDLLKKDIQLGINKTQTAIANGTAFKSSLDALKAELLKANQRSIELKATRKGYTDMLSLFVTKTVDEQTELVTPQAPLTAQTINRPELQMYDYQSKSLDVQSRMITAKNLPKLNLFLQGGYGRPALNMLSNDFESYYIGGLRLNWSLSGFYTYGKEKELVNINRKTIELQKETFLFNTQHTLKQQNAEIYKLQELLATDDEIIGLRNNVKNTSSTQLQNGVINTSDYLREVNAEDQARQTKILHAIQLLMAQYNQQTTTGNSTN
jgi:outer membrane protein TolC